MNTVLTKTNPIAVDDLHNYIASQNPIAPVNLVDLVHHFNPALNDIEPTYVQINNGGLDLRELTNAINFAVCMDTVSKFDEHRITKPLIEYNLDSEALHLVGYVFRPNTGSMIDSPSIINSDQINDYHLVTNQQYLMELNQFIDTLNNH